MVAMGRLDQYLKQRGQRWHYIRRVPLEHAEDDPRGVIRTSIETSPIEVARARRDALAEAHEAFWASLTVAPAEAAVQRYRSAKMQAMAKGFVYSPVAVLVQAPVEQVIGRVRVVEEAGPNAEEDDAALLGAVPEAAPPVSKAFETYCDEIAVSDTLGKSPEQAASWRKVEVRAMNNFIAVCGDLPMDEVGRDHGRASYNW